jgi:hypothetical protein
VCVRTRFTSAPIFSKCDIPFPIYINWLTHEGKNQIYQSKLVWEHLQWTQFSIRVVLQHEQRGPTIQIECREFHATSPEQLRLYYKHESGWKWIESTSVALARHEVEDLDPYVSDYTKFYLAQHRDGVSWLSQVFVEAERNITVSTASTMC